MIDRNPQRLKRPGGRMSPGPMLSPRSAQGATHCLGQLPRRGETLAFSSPDDIPGDTAGSPILAIGEDQIGQGFFVVPIDYIGSRSLQAFITCTPLSIGTLFYFNNKDIILTTCVHVKSKYTQHGS